MVPTKFNHYTWDFSSLATLGSGGEANDIYTCIGIARLLERYGAPENVLLPGFGMTETCAGAVYNTNCPAYDVQQKRTFASLGKCIPGMEIRVALPLSASEEGPSLAPPNMTGNLEVRGVVVFGGYYNNPEATADAFTADGWFRTGDTAMIDNDGNLCLSGRVKDIVNINGLKVECGEVQTALEGAVGSRVVRMVVFPSRTDGGYTEQVTVALVLDTSHFEDETVADIHDRIVEACILATSSSPVVFSMADGSLLPETSLGKIPRVKMRELFEAPDSVFAPYVESHKAAVQRYRLNKMRSPSNELQRQLLEDFANLLGVQPEALGIDVPVFELGFTSMDLIRLKQRIRTRLGVTVPVITLMKNPSVASLASALTEMLKQGDCPLPLRSEFPIAPADPCLRGPQNSASEFNPVVCLRASGSKTPLWLVHPGVGEVLVFINLASQLASDNRPVYALRARGFEPNQSRFTSLEEALSVYTSSILRIQPRGPYAVAGYSYGACLAFEIAKSLPEGSVKFVGNFNLPPHIRHRMRHLNWNMCLLNLGHFIGLVSEQFVGQQEQAGFREIPKTEAMTRLLEATDKDRLAELGLTKQELANWADVAAGLQAMAVNYDPTGKVPVLDVFHAIPLRTVTHSREEWVKKHLCVNAAMRS
ncbi:hypothetical protein DL768_002695 [Monosporascus sp. mg162]|nr:hypothetical protein DL768_002695 [Monosporascus sp. mg162]